MRRQRESVSTKEVEKERSTQKRLCDSRLGLEKQLRKKTNCDYHLFLKNYSVSPNLGKTFGGKCHAVSRSARHRLVNAKSPSGFACRVRRNKDKRRMEPKEQAVNLLGKIWAKLQSLPSANPVELGGFFILLTFILVVVAMAVLICATYSCCCCCCCRRDKKEGANI